MIFWMQSLISKVTSTSPGIPAPVHYKSSQSARVCWSANTLKGISSEISKSRGFRSDPVIYIHLQINIWKPSQCLKSIPRQDLWINFSRRIKFYCLKAMQGYLFLHFYYFHYYLYLFICLFMHLYTFISTF